MCSPGVHTFQSHLQMEKDLKVSKNRILKAFRMIPNWIMALKRRRKFKRRQYIADGAKEV